VFPGAAQIESAVLCMKDVDDDGYGDLAAANPIHARHRLQRCRRCFSPWRAGAVRRRRQRLQRLRACD
jgi:hypothetical protein